MRARALSQPGVPVPDRGLSERWNGRAGASSEPAHPLGGYLQAGLC